MIRNWEDVVFSEFLGFVLSHDGFPLYLSGLTWILMVVQSAVRVEIEWKCGSKQQSKAYLFIFKPYSHVFF